jgi:hypothetical protein
LCRGSIGYRPRWYSVRPSGNSVKICSVTSRRESGTYPGASMLDMLVRVLFQGPGTVTKSLHLDCVSVPGAAGCLPCAPSWRYQRRAHGLTGAFANHLLCSVEAHRSELLIQNTSKWYVNCVPLLPYNPIHRRTHRKLGLALKTTNSRPRWSRSSPKNGRGDLWL